MNLERDEQDRALLHAVGRDDNAALDALMRRYWPLLAALAARLTSPSDAEDITLDTFVKLWQRRQSWDAVISVRALLFRITRNLALNHRRSADRAERRLSTAPRETATRYTAADELVAADLQEAFDAALDRLPPRRREVYQLVRFDGLDYREAADVLGLAPQTTANHLAAAVRDLRAALADRLDRDPIRPIEGTRLTSP